MSKHGSRISRSTWDLVETLVVQDWSPEQISHWLKQEKQGIVSHESIYQYILRDKSCGGTLHQHLRCQKKRRKRYGSYSRRGTITNRVSIEQRPEIVARKTRIGDWEADTIIGRNHCQALVSLTERKTKLTFLAKLEQKTAILVSQAIITLLNPIQDQVKTITSDNGKEFARHENIANHLRADFFFAHPYSSWERGLNENTNGLVRQYFPNSMDFRTITDTMLQNVMGKINNRPRKTMGYQTPYQVFFGLKSNVALTT
ncbi:MAG: IS30 family transposase [Deltaproteobacteria bacterium]|nr:IS30 family transposase [Deltaproteobacteria bacterium]